MVQLDELTTGVLSMKMSSLLGLAFGAGIIYVALKAIYNLYFHPLRHFPGPLLHRASPIPWAVEHVLGIEPFATQRRHDKYGPVIRIAPNHLAFTDPAAWKDIYGTLVGHKSGQREMEKGRAFVRALDDVARSIFNADRDEHRRVRGALSHGFSDSSLRSQEHIIRRYTDQLLQRMHKLCASGPMNIEAWYNWTTFDITGDLIFGQTFGCLAGSEYHPWIAYIFGTLRVGSWMTVLSYLGMHGLVQAIYRYASRVGMADLKNMQAYTETMMRSRLAEKRDDDLFEGLLKHQDEWDMSFEKLCSNAFILVLGGSETTATTLSGATYMLATHPDKLEKLKTEVRGAFKSVDEINMASVNKLSYMLAVLTEALRLYPPVSSGLCRVVPPGGANIAGRWVAGGTYVEVQHWSINHSSDHWADPWEFKPERFLRSEDSSAKSGDVIEALQPFSAGPRNCIGRNLAYAEMRLILARIIYDFDIKLADDSQNWIEKQKAYILWDRIPLNVYFKPVQR
ncbi:isotrichodermin C-15 hydroxylase [Echria macrotheca]|uniref:Isotrichodermin C-15 hydroxylase n=1 Tax=Echria macrotheca TaxID=438768 RepID=A0AAJ0BGG5_9PEZI|nr:isotrichodermin C-15 hydroxylase [Echria macrotheca]